MPCFYPLTAYRSDQVTPTGKRKIVFDASKSIDKIPFGLGCGQCSGCRLERSRQWMVRIMHEAAQHDHNMFITVTYDDEHLPTTHEESVRNYQLFMKKLRFKYPGKKISFYHTAENGEENERHHHHAIIFNFEFPDKKFSRYSEHVDKSANSVGWVKPTKDMPEPGKVIYRPLTNISSLSPDKAQSHAPGAIYTSEQFTKLWANGICEFGGVTIQSAAYCSRYIMTKVNGDDAEEHYERVDTETGELYSLIPEYSTMSRNPGIGKAWYDKYKNETYVHDSIIINGREVLPPKYYDRLIEEEMPDLIKAVKARRQANIKKQKANNTPERLLTREICMESRKKKLKRSL